MLVHVIGNASPSQLEPPPKAKEDAPVLREKVFGLPVDRDILFADEHNIYQPAIEKRQRKWIVKLSFLKPFLLSGERILRITPARSPIRWREQLVTGGLFLGLERAFLVFTTYRLLHIPTGSNFAYRQCIAQVRYRDIRSIRLGWQGLVMDYKNGRRECFGSIPRRERKKIRQLLPVLPLVKQVLQPVGRRHLCPRCTAVLSERTMRCRRCALSFKSRKIAALMALLFPGGGYFYTRLFFPALVFGLLETLILAAFVAVWEQLLPAGEHRALVLAALVLIGIGLKAAGWLHAGHFLGQYIPRKTRLGRWSPSVSAA
jgi:hypothetical protein